jgi:hypothetical protein
MPDKSFTEIDAGRLIQAVETLTKEVCVLTERVRELETQLARGKGILSGIVLLSGAFGAALTAIFQKWW